MKKQICAALLALALCAGPILPTAQAAESPKILSVTACRTEKDAYLQLSVDGKEIPFSALDGYGQPFIDESGSSLVPMRKFAEAAGGTVDWDSAAKRVTIQQGEDTISLVIGEMSLTKNGVPSPLDTAARVINGSTYIPLRAAAEALGYAVEYAQRPAVYGDLRLERWDIASAHCQASAPAGGNPPLIALNEQQTDQLWELFNRACMTSEWKEADFFEDTVRTYSVTADIALKYTGHMVLRCRGWGEDGDEIRCSRSGADGNLSGQFLLTDHALYSFLRQAAK